MDNSEQGAGYDIAIVGMAVRVPGATDPDQYWTNLRDGVESVKFYSDEELAERGVSPQQLKNPHYVKAGAPLDDVAGFDPEFFGFSPKEAGILDPQHRQFYECSWEALERAGHVPETFDGAIGVFAGCGMGAYFAYNILSNPDLVNSVGLFLLRHTGNDKDFLSTRVSYSFNLKGPSVNVQTACSTSAVATHLACQSLMSGECDMALAGGVTLEIPHNVGYVYKEGEILSPDGHCRPFDHRSKGTIFGSGTGVLVLRRLEDALEDGDHIHAIISGSAINNDGSSKVGYLAPSVEGQAQAVTEALAMADISAENLGYVECHGTGTPVGDPIEVAALTQAFRQTSDRTGYCGLGSVKSNIGHLDTAAGVASLIKTTLALEHGKIPPSLNFEAPNPTIDFESSPFYVNNALKDWPASDGPRRAAVNSLGVGGTNAFIILEQPPEPPPPADSTRACQLFVLSGRNRGALDDISQKLATHLESSEPQSLADIAHTLFTGRKAFEHRRVLACHNREEGIELLKSNDPKRVFSHRADEESKSLVFMFPGGGAQYVNMARGLYDAEPVFKQHVDAGLAALSKISEADLKPLIFADDENIETAKSQLQIPSLQLPAIFIIEYALAKLWISLGVEPKALIGHSMGENTAACLAGVLSFDDAIGLVHLRGSLMDGVPAGGMLSVQLSADQLQQYLTDDGEFAKLDLAAINSPGLAVVSGPVAALHALANRLQEQNIESQHIKINIAAHSAMLDGILEPFGNYLRGITLNAPKIPFISNRTGTWITDQQATDPEYWVSHLRNTVHFAQGIDTLLEDAGRVFLEVGPGNTLGSLTRQNPEAPTQRVFSSLRHPDETVADDSYFLTVLGRLWAVGLDIDANRIWPEQGRRKVPLPTYAFQHKDYWIEPGKVSAENKLAFAQLEKIEDFSQWFRKPTWIQQGILPSPIIEPCTWLAFIDDSALCTQLIDRLRAAGHNIVTVREGDAYYRISQTDYRISPEAGSEGYATLVKDLVANGTVPKRILHTWLTTEQETFRPGSSFFHRNQEYGFYSLFFLAKALVDENLIDDPIHLSVISNGMQQVQDESLPYPDKATALGPCKIIPREFPGISCSSIDIVLPKASEGLFSKQTNTQAETDRLVTALTTELLVAGDNNAIAYRDQVRWQQCYDHIPLQQQDQPLPRLKDQGVYLITGGLGGIGYVMAEHLAESKAARLVLVNRTPLPPRSEWADWLRQHSHDDPISRNIGKVKHLEDKGADVLILSGDVTDVDRMKQIVEEATQKFGAINGVLHAAGRVNDNLIQLKTQTEIEEVFTPKVYGTLVLDEVFRDVPLDFMVLFSSTSTAIAPIGQIDYVAANSFLNAYAQSQNQQQRYTVAINWGVWNEVGMAADAAKEMGFGGKNVSSQESSPANYVLFDSHEIKTQGVITTHTLGAYISPQTHWLLDQHRTIGGQALLPGTAYIELARAALAEAGESKPFEIRELVFFNALYVEDKSTKQIRIKLTSTEEGYSYALQSRRELADGRIGWDTHAQARIVISARLTPKTAALDSIMQRCALAPIDAKNTPAIRSRQEDHLNFGPQWHVLRQQAYGSQEALAQLSLDDQFKADLDDFRLHPGLLDLATGYAMNLIEGYADSDTASNLWVPVSYSSFRYFAPLTQEIYSWVRASRPVSVKDDFASFDVTLFDSKGHVLAEIDQLTIHKLQGEIDFSATPSDRNFEIDADKAASSQEMRQLSPAEMAFQHNLAQGILPSEGAKALDTILSQSTAAQVIVSSLPLEGLIEEAQATSAAQTHDSDGASFARPDLDNDYIEPRDDIERTLVGFWEELLGIDQVGVEDSFFDLGGHSLIAVRLFAKIQQTFSVDYPISVLFEAPTIAQCAALIRETVGDQPSEEEGSNKNKHQTRYTHLVPMHAGKPGNATPFFLVAGMFGNVLNLRHLAHLIGTDRPFFGLQARGLYGDHQPHETFEEMARDYIKEMKTVQAEGPYLLGGFSGGGITAYEIARQLREAGDEVACLILLDTPLAHSDPLSSVDRMSIHWQRLRRKGAGYFTEWAKNRYQWELKKFKKRFNDAEADNTPFDFQSEVIEVAFRRALQLYDTKPQPLDVTLFRPKLNKAYTLSGGRIANLDREFVYEDNGWSPYVRAIDVHEVPGDHDSMVLEPNVRVLASQMAKCITDADGRS